MAIQRMEHVGIVVDDLAAAKAFFVELGLRLQGEWPAVGEWVDRIVGLEGVRVLWSSATAVTAGGAGERTKGRGLPDAARSNLEALRDPPVEE